MDSANNHLQITSPKNGSGPSLQHELARRKVDRVSLEFWFFLRSELTKLKSKTTEASVVKAINLLLADSVDYQTMFRNDFYKLANDVDNLKNWRQQESLKTGDLVQRRLEYLQNPKDCRKAKKMLCNLGKGCGYGCQLHHVTYCLMMAYATERTLILDSKGWRYASGGWETVFLPLSNNCRDTYGGDVKKWGAESSISNTLIVEMPIIDSLHPRPKSLPLAVPEDLADRLMRFHGDPSVWWIGQFVKYLTRPQKHLEEDLLESKNKLGFEGPIVGVHVRRTDKVGLEAAFHSVDEYMGHVNDWFNVYAKRHPDVKRRVYLASDDPAVLKEAQENYKSYTFISDNEVSKSAGLGTRYTDASLRGVILDIHFLSLCDYLVCTFSSQVCRVAYEMMQTMHGDASQFFKSLDDIYYFGGQNGHNVEAIESHTMKLDDKQAQIEMQPRDIIGIAGNHWDGYSKGKNSRTGKTGLFPSYKALDTVVRVEMPTYPEVKEL